MVSTGWGNGHPATDLINKRRSLGLTIDAKTTLDALSVELDATWLAVAARLPDNPAIQLSENTEGKTELSLGRWTSWTSPARCCNCGRPCLT